MLTVVFLLHAKHRSKSRTVTLTAPFTIC